MQRLEGWESRLNDYLASTKDVEFQYGICDCTLFASQLSILLLGIDYMADFRGKYRSEQEANELIKSIGGLKSHLDNILEPVDLKMVRRGDVVMYQGALGICNGVLSHFIQPNKGRVTLKTSKCDYAWKIGD